MRRVSARGIIVHEGRLLGLRLRPYKELAASISKYWVLPGGSVDEGESLEAAVRRELLEELGVEPEIGQLLYVQQFTHNGHESLEFFFHVLNAADYLTLDLSAASHAAEEIEQAEFVDPSTEPFLPKFLSTERLDEQLKPETPVRFFSLL